MGRRYPSERGTIRHEPVADLDSSELVRVWIEIPQRVPVYQLCLDTLVAIDVWCRRRWRFPSVYDGGIRYEAEPLGLELFASTPVVFARRFGDCEDLACDVVAERLLSGISARAALRLEEQNEQGDFWHVLVEHKSGRLEDPSITLGMR